jgi:plastocyanin
MDKPDNLQPKTKEAKTSNPKSSSKILIAIIGVAVVLAVCAYLLSNRSGDSSFATKSNTTQVKPTVRENSVISITGSSFSPATLQIKAGSQVTWTNKDTTKHQVAADPHALHNSIPGFNSDLVLNPNDNYNYTFEQAGTYYYHDEMHPLDMRGTIVVK